MTLSEALEGGVARWQPSGDFAWRVYRRPDRAISVWTERWRDDGQRYETQPVQFAGLATLLVERPEFAGQQWQKA